MPLLKHWHTFEVHPVHEAGVLARPTLRDRRQCWCGAVIEDGRLVRLGHPFGHVRRIEASLPTDAPIREPSAAEKAQATRRELGPRFPRSPRRSTVTAEVPLLRTVVRGMKRPR